jgi:hypothetical protein
LHTGQLFGLIQLQEVGHVGTQFPVVCHGFGHRLAQQRIKRRHAFDAGVVQAGGARLAAEFAQFVQLLDDAHLESSSVSAGWHAVAADRC